MPGSGLALAAALCVATGLPAAAEPTFSALVDQSFEAQAKRLTVPGCYSSGASGSTR